MGAGWEVGEGETVMGDWGWEAAGCRAKYAEVFRVPVCSRSHLRNRERTAMTPGGQGGEETRHAPPKLWTCACALLLLARAARRQHRPTWGEEEMGGARAAVGWEGAGWAMAAVGKAEEGWGWGAVGGAAAATARVGAGWGVAGCRRDMHGRELNQSAHTAI